MFDKAYRPVAGLSFGLAVEALKSGKRVTRAGWNGKGLWPELVQQSPSVDLPYIRLINPLTDASIFTFQTNNLLHLSIYHT